MKFKCDNCGAEYLIADEKLGTKGVKVKCRSCGSIIKVRPPGEEADAQPAKVPSYDAIKSKAAPQSSPEKQPDKVEGKGRPLSSSLEEQLSELSSGLELDIPEPPEAPPPAPVEEEGIEDIPPPPEDEGLENLPFDEEPPAPEERRVEAKKESSASNSKRAPVASAAREEGGFPIPAAPQKMAPQKVSRARDEDDEHLDKVLSQKEEPFDLDVQSTRIIQAPEEALRKLDKAAEKMSQKPAVEWFVAMNNQQTGPLTERNLEALWKRGEINQDSLVWMAEYSDWVPLAQAKELKRLLTITNPKAVEIDDELLPLPEEISAPPVEEPEKPKEKSQPEEEWKPKAGKALSSVVKDELSLLDALEKEEKEKAEAVAKEKEIESELPEREPLLDIEPEDLPFSNVSSLQEEKPAAYDDDKTVLRPRRPAPAPAPAPAPSSFQPLPPVKAPSGSLPKTAYYEPGLVSSVRKKAASPVIYIAIGAGALVVVLLITVVVLLTRKEPQPVATQETQETVVAQTGNTGIEEKADVNANKEKQENPPAQKQEVAEPKEPEKTVVEQQAKKEEQEEVPSKKEDKSDRRKKKEKPERVSKRSAREEREERKADIAPPPEKEKPQAVASTKSETKKGGGGDDLLNFEKGDDKEDVARIVASISSNEEKQKKMEMQKKNEKKKEAPPPPEPAQTSLSKEQVKAVIDRNSANISRCVQQQKQKNPLVQGTMKIQWLISPDGSTSDIKTVTPGFANTDVYRCVTALVQRWRFEKFNGKPMPITYPFIVK